VNARFDKLRAWPEPRTKAR